MGIVDNALMGASGNQGYNLQRSLRFRSSASAYLNRTFGTPTNNKIWTFSTWVKRGTFSSQQMLIGTVDDNTANGNYAGIMCNSSNQLQYFEYSTGYTLNIITSQIFRDPSAWYHIVVSVDTTQATASNRIKFYVNGSQVTAFGTATYPPQNQTLYINKASQATYFSSSYLQSVSAANFFDGYRAESVFVDGQQLTPSSFGSTNALTGVWQPARYTGTYGTNGFYLPFTDNSALTTSSNVGLGKDFSGNGNYWTTNNISITAGVTYDSMMDVPTLTSATAANFAVLNPLDNGGNTVSNGNLVVNTATGFDLIRSTMFLSSGKWYWEVTCDDCGEGFVGISSAAEGLNTRGAETANSATIRTTNGDLRTNATNSAYGSAVADGNVMMFALDMDSGKFWAGKSGTWFNSGDPTAGTNAGKTGLTVAVSPSISVYDNEDYTANFGQRPFTYTPPTGFVSLNTFNLPTSTIVNGAKEMGILLYTGDGTTSKDVTGLSFQPDLTYVKNRSAASDPTFSDTLRGITKVLYTDSASGESTAPSFGYINSILSTGFNVNSGGGTEANFNKSGQNYVGWTWKAGQGSTSSNTNGTITSTVSVNASAGLSMVTYTGTGANATVGHGLGVAPQFIIVKSRNPSTVGLATSSWIVYTSAIGAGAALILNVTNATNTSSVWWNNTAPTSSVFSLGNDQNINESGRTFVAYCWTPIAGYSAFGSYTGNGSTDGPFVYTNFQPKFVLIKASSTTSQWVLWDAARNTYNVTNSILYPNLSAAEASFSIDILSNGFKFREAGGAGNDSGVTYIYAAFATSPFKNSLAR